MACALHELEHFFAQLPKFLITTFHLAHVLRLYEYAIASLISAAISTHHHDIDMLRVLASCYPSQNNMSVRK